jgi:hypothetical protein
MKALPELVAIVRLDWHLGIPDGECWEDHVLPHGSTDRSGILALYERSFSEAIRGRPTSYSSWDNGASGCLSVDGSDYRDRVDVTFKVEPALRFGDGEDAPCFALAPAKVRRPRHG